MKTFLITLLVCASTTYAASSELATAAERRDSASLKSLLTKHADVNATAADGSTALLWAAHWNDMESVKSLLAAGANPKLANRFGASPLAEAATLGNAAMVKTLLDAGADPKTLTTADGETVLMTAARSGSADAVKLFLDRGVDINAKESYKGQTALMWAAAERHADVVKLLLERGADWKMMSNDHETKMPKLSAASSVSPMPRGGLTAFDFAAREGHIPTAEALLAAGVDINQLDVDKESVLLVSLMNKQWTFAKFLLDKGANPNLVDVNGRTALYAAVDMRNEDYSANPGRPNVDPMPSIEIVKALLDKGADPNIALTVKLPGRSGMDQGDTSLGAGTTPLMRAGRAGDAETMRLLLAKGADPKKATKEGNTALMFAAGVGYRDKNTTGTEGQALEALQVALAQGLDVNQANGRGETALHGAASRGADMIVQFLADKGAKLDVKSRGGQTALDVAMGKGSFGLPTPHDSTVALLKKLGAHEAKDVPTVAAAVPAK
ncbi:MAG: ankyrin repeat domain-containing protein [Acidobacteriota bacterium]